MRSKAIILLFLGSLFAFKPVKAQKNTELAQSRILILLDASSSMLNQWAGGQPKYKIAESIILKLMDSIYAVNPDVEFSLRVFGHQSPVPENDCHDTRNEVPFAKDNRLQMEYRLDDIKPLGVTSIAYSLKQAALNDLVDADRNAYSIVLVTDGGESCGGNICDVMKLLINQKVFFKPYIVGLEDVPGLQKEYECMGDYLQVTKPGDISKAIAIIVDAFRPMIKMTKTAYKELQAAPQPKIEEKKVEAPKPIAPAPAKPQTIDQLDIHNFRSFNTTVQAEASLVALKVPALAVPDAGTPETPEKPQPDNITNMALARPLSMSITPTSAKTMTPMEVPAMPVAEEVPVKPAPENIAKLTTSGSAGLTVAQPKATKMATMAIPVMPELPAEKPVPENIARLAYSSAAITIPAPKAAKLKTQTVQPMPVVEVEVEKPAPVAISALKLSRIHDFTVMWVMDDKGFNPRPVPFMPALRIDDQVAKVATAAPKPATLPTPAAPDGVKLMEYVIKTEDAKETTVEVYFTDGKGKFYTTTPQVLLLDPKTKKTMKSFYRTVDPVGNPDPQQDIPVGTYDLTFANKRSYVLSNVKVEPHKRNVITVKLPKPTLSFVYAEPGDFGHVAKRPVSEFSAVVTERNKAQGRVQSQKCTEALEYEPGNYHIEVNTFPQDIRNVDLDFAETVITLPQPGFAKFTPSDDKQRAVVLYQRMGDRFLMFYTQQLADPRSKHLNLQPGDYQAHYSKGPGGSASEKVKNFTVRATQETEVTLD